MARFVFDRTAFHSRVFVLVFVTVALALPTSVVMANELPGRPQSTIGCQAGDSDCIPVVTSEKGILAPRTVGEAPAVWESASSSRDVVVSSVQAAAAWYNWGLSDTLHYYAYNSSTGQSVEVGSVFVRVKINLNGFKATWTQLSDMFEGPAIKAVLQYACREANGALPAGHCVGIDGFNAVQDTIYRTGEWKTVADTLHGRHEDVYWWQYRWSWQAQGWPGWTWVSSNSYQSSPQYECRESWTDKCRGK
jgi:hypothetical protein